MSQTHHCLNNFFSASVLFSVDLSLLSIKKCYRIKNTLFGGVGLYYRQWNSNIAFFFVTP